MRLTDRIGRWFDQRVRFASAANLSIFHHVPRRTASWFYVFGSAATVVLALQVVTGSSSHSSMSRLPERPGTACHTLNQHVSAGWFIRALPRLGIELHGRHRAHSHGAGFLFGAYKYPRELTWIAGVVLLLMTLGMAFTGQVLRFDQDAYWGLGIGASISSRVPFIGHTIVDLLLGGPIIAGATLSRFFALHVFVVPGLLIAFVALHLVLVLRLGSTTGDAGADRQARHVRRAIRGARQARRDSVRPRGHRKDIIFSGVVLLSIAACAAFLGPFGPGGQPDPTIIQTAPKPDFFFCGSTRCSRICRRG